MRRDDEIAALAHADGVAVAARVLRIFQADLAARAGAVFDDEGLPILSDIFGPMRRDRISAGVSGRERG